MKRLNDNELVILDPLDQSSPEWLQWRGKGIGSSDVAVLMSSAPVFDRTVGTLWKQKVGYERAVALDNPHIRRGKELEPIICEKVNKILGSKFEPVCLFRKDAPYLRASLDGFDKQLDALLEIKAPSDNVFNKYLRAWENAVEGYGVCDAKAVIPKNYYEQMQYQMLVSDVEYAYFAFFNQTHPTPLIIPVENDLETQLEIEKRCHLFWKAVQTRTAIGWEGEQLRLFHQRPVLILVSCSKGQFKTIAARKYALPVINPTDEHRGSGIGFLVEGSHFTLPEIQNNNPNHEIKILNLHPSPFGRAEVQVQHLDSMIRRAVSSSVPA
jgi:putative phage-type endonuclease